MPFPMGKLGGRGKYMGVGIDRVVWFFGKTEESHRSTRNGMAHMTKGCCFFCVFQDFVCLCRCPKQLDAFLRKLVERSCFWECSKQSFLLFPGGTFSERAETTPLFAQAAECPFWVAGTILKVKLMKWLFEKSSTSNSWQVREYWQFKLSCISVRWCVFLKHPIPVCFVTKM